jgi:cellulose synthase/poly-beta-1,6-N-acetylglucosamine synthase-like glycosyltransferase
MDVSEIIQYILLVAPALAVLYILIFAVAGLFYRQKGYPGTAVQRRIAVLIPGYREDEVIIETASDALLQNYPSNLYDVIIIADSFSPGTLEYLRGMTVKVIEVSFEKSTKSKALNKAMEQLPETYDIAVILDADNLMEPDFLSKVNSVFEGPVNAVQGHRTAKNMNTRLAILDAASEEINNHIFRKGHRALGLSSAIIGSGMAFRYLFFRDLMSDIKAVGGFDKEIELKMLRNGHLIEYLDDAWVYDEKVQKEEVFSNQRRRWLSAQFYYFRKDFLRALKDLLVHGNIDYFDKAIQFIQPPRILLLGAVLFLGLVFIPVDFLIFKNMNLGILWCILIAACLVSFLFSLPRSFYNKQTITALAGLPKGILLMFLSLLKIRGANKTFLHTSHSSVSSQDKNSNG